MSEYVAEKRGNITRKNKTSIESDHGQNSPVVHVLFTVLTMIRGERLLLVVDIHWN